MVRRVNDGFNTFAAAAISSLSVLFLEKPTKGESSVKTLGLYLFSRVAQCVFNSLYNKNGPWKIPGTGWELSYTLLFVLSVTEIMYAYVMRPDCLPSSYFKFIADLSPIQRHVVEATRKSVRGMSVDNEALNQFVRKFSPLSGNPLSSPLVASVPCSVLHPQSSNCVVQQKFTFFKCFKQVFPIYLSVTFLPMFLTRLTAVFKRPFLLLKGLLACIRSSAFIASLTSLYMAVVCLSKRTLSTDSKYVYYVAAFVSSWSILLEKADKHQEFALYAFSRALDVVYNHLIQKGLPLALPQGEILLFCFSMGMLMYFREFERSSVSNYLNATFDFILGKPKSQHIARQKEHPQNEQTVYPNKL